MGLFHKKTPETSGPPPGHANYQAYPAQTGPPLPPPPPEYQRKCFVFKLFQKLFLNLFFCRRSCYCWWKRSYVHKVSILPPWNVDTSSQSTNQSHSHVCLHYLSLCRTMLCIHLPVLCLCGYGTLLYELWRSSCTFCKLISCVRK